MLPRTSSLQPRGSSGAGPLFGMHGIEEDEKQTPGEAAAQGYSTRRILFKENAAGSWKRPSLDQKWNFEARARGKASDTRFLKRHTVAFPVDGATGALYASLPPLVCIAIAANNK